MSVTCNRFQWFSQSTLVSSTNKTDRHDITEILLKVALNTIKPNKKKPSSYYTTNQIGLLTLPPHPSPPTFWQNLYLQLVLKIYLWDLLVFFRPPSTIYTTISFFIWRIKLVSSPSFSSPIWWKLYGIALTQTFCILWDFHSTVKCSKNKIWLDIFFFFFLSILWGRDGAHFYLLIIIFYYFWGWSLFHLYWLLMSQCQIIT